MEHLTGYVGGIVRSEKYKTGRDFFRLAGSAHRCIRTKRRYVIGRESRGISGVQIGPARPRLPEFSFPPALGPWERVKVAIAPLVEE